MSAQPVLLPKKLYFDESIQVPKEIRNEFKVSVDGKDFVYVATAFNLWMDALNIRGNGLLQKFEIIAEPSRRRVSWVPSRFETVTIEKRRIVWEVYAAASRGDRGNFWIFSGEPIIDKVYTYSCRSLLIGQAANGGILLSDRLLDQVLGPIYKQLMDIYNKVLNFK